MRKNYESLDLLKLFKIFAIERVCNELLRNTELSVVEQVRSNENVPFGLQFSQQKLALSASFALERVYTKLRNFSLRNTELELFGASALPVDSVSFVKVSIEWQARSIEN